MAVLHDGTALKQGTFIVSSLLGRGGFGEVYLARQPRMNRDVAVKVLLPNHSHDESMVRRFEREALAAGSLLHPNILPVFDFDFDEQLGVYFLAMQYVPGGQTLQLHVGSPMDPAELCPTLAALGSALDSAHEHGIIHRDVKPPNVLLHGTRPLLTDFGIARLGAMAGITALGTTIGTPSYMSPEQATGQPVVPESDQYSLAIMAYELLAARLPFFGDPLSILMQQVSNTPPSIIDLNPRLPSEFAQVFERALAKKPADRFPSCVAFATALHEITIRFPAPPATDPSGTVALATIAITATPDVAPVPSSSPEKARVVVDLSGRIVSMNAEAEHLLGFSAIEAVGEPYTLAFGPSLADRIVGLFMHAARSREAQAPQVVEATLPDGRRTILEATVEATFDSSGAISGVMFTAQAAQEEP